MWHMSYTYIYSISIKNSMNHQWEKIRYLSFCIWFISFCLMIPNCIYFLLYGWVKFCCHFFFKAKNKNYHMTKLHHFCNHLLCNTALESHCAVSWGVCQQVGGLKHNKDPTSTPGVSSSHGGCLCTLSLSETEECLYHEDSPNLKFSRVCNTQHSDLIWTMTKTFHQHKVKWFFFFP